MNRFKQFACSIFRFIDRALTDNVSVFAAQASFFILISSIPFLMLLLALVQFFIPLNTDDILKMINITLPAQLGSFLTAIIGEVFSRSSAVSIISITAVTTLWSASRGIMALEQGLNNVCRYRGSRNYIWRRIVAFFYTLVFILALLLTLLAFVFGNKLEILLSTKFSFISTVISVILNARILIFILLLTLCFALLYTILPGPKLRFRRQLPGALAAAIGWMAFSGIYALYIDNFSNFSYVYGSLAAIVLLMLWLYFCMNIFLYGAELNEALEEGMFHFKKR